MQYLINSNDKPLLLIGYTESSITQEILYNYLKVYKNTTIVSPSEFYNIKDKTSYQYFVAFSLDSELRKQIIDFIESNNLFCFSYVDKTASVYDTNLSNFLGHGSAIGLYSSVLLHAKIKKHCIIEPYCLISHYTELGNNCILHAGTMIAGKTKIGNNCLFNFKSSVLNKLTICDDAEVGAFSSVTKDIIKPGKYIGTPARFFNN
jgi:acetyltransferase-like isoleucine patch superfamily enzyme